MISGRQPGLAAGLGSDPGLGLGGGESVAVEQPPDLGFLINIDHHHDVESVLLTGFHQQRDDVNHHSILGRGLLQLGCAGAYRWMNDPLKITTGLRVGEDDLAQRGAIQPAVASAPRRRTVPRSRPARGPRLHHLARQHVGVDHHSTYARPVRQPPGSCPRRSRPSAPPSHMPQRLRSCSHPRSQEAPAQPDRRTSARPLAVQTVERASTDVLSRSAAAGELLAKLLQCLVRGQRAFRSGRAAGTLASELDE